MDNPHIRHTNIHEILRNTLRHLEEDAEFCQDDPAVVHLKSHLLRSLAELELKKSAGPTLESEPDAGKSQQEAGVEKSI
jgi:hypothetical protein